MADSFPNFCAVGPDYMVVRVVRIDSDGKEVRGTVVLTGFPYPPAQAVIEASEISESDAKRLTNKLKRPNKAHHQLQSLMPTMRSLCENRAARSA